MSTMKPKLYWIFVYCVLTLLSLCPVGCLSFEKLNWDSQQGSQQGRDLATSGGNEKNFQLGQSYSCIMRKVWYHQIWIQKNLGFIVSDLIYIAYEEFSARLGLCPFPFSSEISLCRLENWQILGFPVSLNISTSNSCIHCIFCHSAEFFTFTYTSLWKPALIQLN